MPGRPSNLEMIHLIASVITALLKLLFYGFQGMRQDRRREWWEPIPEQLRNIVPERESIYLQPRQRPIAIVSGSRYDHLGKGTQCQVCGEELGQDLVACRSCATLHHRDCWDYNRGCSTYGCRPAA